MESGKWHSAVANKPDTTENVSNQLSKQAENMPDQQGKESKRLPDTLKAMLALISRNHQVTYEQLAKELNISRKTVRHHIGKLRGDYKIISRFGKTKGYWIIHTK